MLSPGPVPKLTPLVQLDRAAEVLETSFIHPLHRCPSVNTRTGIADCLFWKMPRKQLFSNGHEGKNYRRQMENMFHIFKCDIRHKQIDNYCTML